ncbi:uncharacterized protein LOC132629144 [Lycium barbarum]|uniref:uncharacterized protein LOC132629144 n=1 Tax=Lycium barbarum TaxID=112863 RepID=UPI00293E576F|nr:uncharacterized protein LOC132629144 [Lycium barbarum]
MDNEVFDNVKFEKAKAVARYNRFQNMMKMLQIFEVLVAVVLISWSWTRIPVAVKLSGRFFVQLSSHLFKPHVVFLIGNAIIVAIVVLCRQNDAINNSNNSDTDDIQIEEIHNTEIQRQIVPDLTTEPNVTTTITEDKQIIPEPQCNDAATAIDKATKQIQKFKRTQSEKLKRQITANQPKRGLRRSETDMRRIVRKPTVEVEEVETLSNEEFRDTIEAFIKKNQIFFEKQRLAETEPEKYERIGIEAF